LHFLAARARRTENSAIAKSSELLRGGKTGHSCMTQQNQSGELTGRPTMHSLKQNET
jgi:hypothetical protein